MKHKSFAPWAVALVCFGPFAAALFIYYGLGPNWLPQLPGSRELLREPVQLPQDWRAGSALGDGETPAAWQLIYARMTPCEQQCVQHLGRLLQVQRALGRDQDRVERAVWHVGDAPPLEDPELTAHTLEGEPGRGLAEVLGVERLTGGRVLLADPRGAVVLSYPPDVEQKELLRDLKRLLAGSDS